jgi:type IV pilus biogenesis protein CpaD/CtpE
MRTQCRIRLMLRMQRLAPLRWSRKASYRNQKKRRLTPKQTKSLARNQSRGRVQAAIEATKNNKPACIEPAGTSHARVGLQTPSRCDLHAKNLRSAARDRNTDFSDYGCARRFDSSAQFGNPRGENPRSETTYHSERRTCVLCGSARRIYECARALCAAFPINS